MGSFSHAPNNFKENHDAGSNFQAKPSKVKKAKLSPVQKELYLHSLINPDDNTFNIGASIRLDFELEINAWEKAVGRVWSSDDMIRSRFISDNGEACQVVDPEAPIFFEFIDLTIDGEHSSASQFLWKCNREIIDLSVSPLFKNYLVKDSRGYAAAVIAPHIAFDGVAAQAFFQRVGEAYTALTKAGSPEKSQQPSFYEYIENNCPEFDAPELTAYWTDKLAGVEELDLVPPTGGAARNLIKSTIIDKNTVAEIKRFCNANMQNVLAFYRLPAFFMSTYALLLQRLADEDGNLVVFDILSGRPRQHMNTIGCFYKVLPHVFGRELFSESAPIQNLLDHASQYRKNTVSKQNISFTSACRLLGNPKLKCFMNYQGFAAVDLLGKKQPMDVYMHHPEDEVHLAVTDLGDTIKLDFYYNEAAFPYCEFLERFKSAAAQLCRGAGTAGEVDILLQPESDRLKQDAESHELVRPEDLIVARFEARTAAEPERIALTFPPDNDADERGQPGRPVQPQSMTYAELNAGANQLAHCLREFGAGPGDLVAICLKPSIKLVSTILGVLKAGCAYVPMDPDYPRERLKFMLEDSGAGIVAVDGETASYFSSESHSILNIDSEKINEMSNQNPAHPAKANNAAYVIYTSGSTGKPKGVLVDHGNVARLFKQTEDWFAFNQDDVWTLFHSCSFDFSVWELWGALIYGGRLVIAPKSVRRSPEAFLSLLSNEKVTVLNQTPSSFYNLAAIESLLPLSLRYVIFGGEALSLPGLEPWIQKHGDARPRLINMYGITETTVHVSYRPVSAKDLDNALASPIGLPIPDLKIHLLDSKQRLVPMGMAGEICVGGAGVAVEYLNQPELTSEKFIPDPFSGDPNSRLYRSGDLGRIMPDGEFEYLGRIDDQVKVRGFRIELGEVSAAVLKHPAVSQAAVIAQRPSEESNRSAGAGNENRLLAYIVAKSGANLSISDLRKFIEKELPDYMVPSFFFIIDSLPLTSNGKLDKKALPSPDEARPDLDRRYEPPKTADEKKLASLFKEILKVEKVGLYDDFFLLGGHSLAAAQLAAKVRQELGVDLPLYDIFDAPTVAELSKRFAELKTSAEILHLPAIKKAPRDKIIPASFSQERVWFICQLAPGNLAYDFESAIHFKGVLNIEALERSLSEIIRRHEVYRTTFEQTENFVRQIIHPPEPVELPISDISSFDADERDMRAGELLRQAAQPPFRLGELPLVRWSLIKLADDNHILIHYEHHIIHDGWSFIVFLRELLELYKAFSQKKPSPLPEPKIQFADFAVWQREFVSGEVAANQLAFWKEKLSGCPAPLDMPFDRPRPARQTFNGDSVRLDLPATLTDSIHSFAKSNNVTPYMTMLSAYLVLLNCYSGREDIVVGTGIANRRLNETEDLFGMIINNIALRIDLGGNPSFRELAHRVRAAALEAYENQDIPFDQVVEAVNPPRNPSYSPIFQTIFTSYDGPVPALECPGLSITLNEGLSNGSAKFDLNVIVISRVKQTKETSESAPREIPETISLIWEFNTDLYDRSTMERMTSNYLRILENATKDAGARLPQIPVMSDEELYKQLVEFNRTQTSYPRESSIAELFERQAAATPSAAALMFEDQEITYAELNQRANQTAHYLIKMGVGPETMAGLCLERSPELVVGILGILKAGGAYVPFDESYPQQRLLFMLDDARPSVMVTQTKFKNLMPEFKGRSVCLDADWDEIAKEPADNPPVRANARNLAYVMYTSGSTGKPKGVSIEHRSIVRLVKNTNYVDFGEAETFLLYAPISFDASTLELWGSLLNGAKLAIAPPSKLSTKELGELIESRGITTLWLTAALFHQMVDEHPDVLQNVKQLIAGGEALSVPHVEKMIANLGNRKLVNGYGPTENTTFTTCHAMTANSRIGRSVPIGVPISNTQVFILDKRLQPVPTGVHGELYISGDGLSRQYLNRPGLTAEKFIPNPFSPEPGARMYKTGDKVRFLNDGTIEFLGRYDHQVKIRGYRIELGEIETTLAQHPQIRDAVVLCREDVPGDKRLAAYTVVENKESFKIKALRQYLKERLPAYMTPATFVVLDALPLTSNGKIDRDKLPEPEFQRPDSQSALASPKTETEKKIVQIWNEVLRLDAIGIHDDFFELGGHSLLAAQVINRIRGIFDLEIPLSRIFEHPTVFGLGEYIDAAVWSSGKAADPSGMGDFEEGEI